MVDLTTEVTYETAAGMFGRLTGIDVSSERMDALTHQAAEDLTLLEVAPSREQIDQLVAQVSKVRFRRPVLVLGVDGAYVPSRPESARGRRPGQARQRARRAHRACVELAQGAECGSGKDALISPNGHWGVLSAWPPHPYSN
jgi:hypothetical protein